LATLVAFAVGYAVIAWFLRYIATHRFTPFVAYRIVAGVGLLVLIGAGVLTPTS
jgi:undecaprenyl-diphosphatase